MTVQYEVDGDIFREINGNWLYVRVKEFLIKARKIETDQAGNVSEYFQLNDGRIFTRQIPAAHAQRAKISQSNASIPKFVVQTDG